MGVTDKNGLKDRGRKREMDSMKERGINGLTNRERKKRKRESREMDLEMDLERKRIHTL
jgi:hypothetical protein